MCLETCLFQKTGEMAISSHEWSSTGLSKCHLLTKTKQQTMFKVFPHPCMILSWQIPTSNTIGPLSEQLATYYTSNDLSGNGVSWVLSVELVPSCIMGRQKVSVSSQPERILIG